MAKKRMIETIETTIRTLNLGSRRGGRPISPKIEPQRVARYQANVERSASEAEQQRIISRISVLRSLLRWEESSR